MQLPETRRTITRRQIVTAIGAIMAAAGIGAAIGCTRIDLAAAGIGLFALGAWIVCTVEGIR